MINKSKEKFNKNLEERTEIGSRPLILYPGGWHNLPDYIINEVEKQREEQLNEEGEKKKSMATEAEVLAYLYSATCIFPVSDYTYKLYFYLTKKAMENQKVKEIPKFLNKFDKLDDPSLLDKWKKEIWNIQEKAIKEKSKNNPSQKSFL